MICARCHRQVFNYHPSHDVGELIYGPKCFAKAFGKAYKPHSQAVADDKTLDMFSEAVEQETRSENGRIR